MGLFDKFKKKNDIVESKKTEAVEEDKKENCLCWRSRCLECCLFGMTAKEWRESNPELAKDGNIRDYTDLLYLVILNNLQNTNAELIEENNLITN